MRRGPASSKVELAAELEQASAKNLPRVLPLRTVPVVLRQTALALTRL
jgi:hypothetical protein